MLNKRIRLAVVDDHKIVLQGIKTILLGYESVEVVGLYLSAEEFIEKGLPLNPAVLLLDMSLPGISGAELAARIKRLGSTMSIIMLTALDDMNTIRAALEAGVQGFLTKDVEKDELIQAIHQVADEEVFFGKSVSNKVLEVYTSMARKQPQQSLTPREIEVLTLITKGLPHKLMADQLNISVKTVEAHKFNLQQKLKLFSTADLVKYAIKQGYAKL